MKKGFTLAEILITLGVLGILISIIMPGIMTTYKRIELENRFKKASSTIENAVILTLNEHSMETLLNKKTNEKINERIPDDIRNSMNETFSSKLNIGYNYEGALRTNVNKKSVHAFISGKAILPAYVSNLNQKYILKDGISISLMEFQVHGVHDGIKITFDTNGPFKGPNRFGYDIFIYDTGYWNATNCSDITTNRHCAYGCYKYAQQNINPQDKTKEYWKSLKF